MFYEDRKLTREAPATVTADYDECFVQVFCSLTSSFYASSKQTDKKETEATASTSETGGGGQQLQKQTSTSSNDDKSQKYINNIERLFILGKHYPKPISRL